MKLTPVMEQFIVHWGEMGGRWGVNRSVAQIHALLYLAGRPLTADEITEVLGMARSNVSTGLRELQTWGLVRLTHVMGDRRDQFEAFDEPWSIFLKIVAGRREREIQPTIAALRECVAEGEGDSRTEPAVKARIAAMLSFIETLDRWYGEMVQVPRPILTKLIGLGASIARLIPGERKKKAAKAAK